MRPALSTGLADNRIIEAFGPDAACAAASDEAERLLDANEAGSGAHFSPCDGYRYMGECWTGSPAEGNAHAALTEALTAFVGVDGEDAMALAITATWRAA